MELDLLRRTALVADVPHDESARLAEISGTQTYMPGEVGFKAGKPGNLRSLLASSAP